MKGYPEDIQCIIPPSSQEGGIYISNLQAASNLETLSRLGIKAVITACRGYLLKHSPEDLPYYLYLPADDHQSFDISKYFDEAVDFIHEKKKKTNVLVHCMAGISRSVTLVLAYLVKKQQHTSESAYSLVKRQRNKIYPNSGFMEQLKKFEKIANALAGEERSRSRERDVSAGLLRKSPSLASSMLYESREEKRNNGSGYSLSKPHSISKYGSHMDYSPLKYSTVSNNYKGPSIQYSSLISPSPSASALYSPSLIKPISKTLSQTQWNEYSSSSPLKNSNKPNVTPTYPVSPNPKSTLSTNIREYDNKLKADIKRLQAENQKLQLAIEERQRDKARKQKHPVYSEN